MFFCNNLQFSNLAYLMIDSRMFEEFDGAWCIFHGHEKAAKARKSPGQISVGLVELNCCGSKQTKFGTFQRFLMIVAWNTEETAIEFLFLVSGDLRGSVSHESGISPAKILAKDAIKDTFLGMGRPPCSTLIFFDTLWVSFGYGFLLMRGGFLPTNHQLGSYCSTLSHLLISLWRLRTSCARCVGGLTLKP